MGIQTFVGTIRARPRLSEAFDRRTNGLNGLRLALAASVIVWHSWPLTGRELSDGPVRQLLSEGGVDGFFAISGFLITMSWLARPDTWKFCRARLLRIMPGFWAALVFTAFVAAPLGVALTGQGSVTLPDSLHHVLVNSGLWIADFRVGDSPVDMPFGAWNGSLWTLFWEATCYVAVLVAGVVGFLRWPRIASVTAFAVAFAAHIGTVYGPIDNMWAERAGRFGLMFAAGTLVLAFAAHLVVSPLTLAVSAVIVAAAAFTPDYRTIAAVPLAFLLVAGSTLLTSPWWRPANDISYGMYVYACPVQQLLVAAGAAAVPLLGYMALSIVCTVPLAYASWRFLERPALRFK